jgi:hypothetical protein
MNPDGTTRQDQSQESSSHLAAQTLFIHRWRNAVFNASSPEISGLTGRVVHRKGKAHEQRVEAPNVKLVLLALSMFADDDGRQCNPSIANLSAMCGCTEVTAAGALDVAAKHGWIVIHERAGGSALKNALRAYTLTLPPTANVTRARSRWKAGLVPTKAPMLSIGASQGSHAEAPRLPCSASKAPMLGMDEIERASVDESRKESVAIATAAPDLKTLLWSEWKKLSGDTGAFLGKMIKQHGEAAVLAALPDAISKRPAEPKSFLQRCLAPNPGRKGRVDNYGYELDEYGNRTGKRGLVV